MKEINPSLSYRLLYPVVPVIITSKYKDKVVAMPAVSYTIVSNSPAIIAVCIKPTHETYKIIKKSKQIAFTLIDKKDSKIIDRLVAIHGYEEKDKLKKANIDYYFGKKLRLPIPKISVAYIEARLVRQIKAGDHMLLLSRILSAFAIEDFANYWKFRDYKPVLYTGMPNGVQLYNHMIK